MLRRDLGLGPAGRVGPSRPFTGCRVLICRLRRLDWLVQVTACAKMRPLPGRWAGGQASAAQFCPHSICWLFLLSKASLRGPLPSCSELTIQSRVPERKGLTLRSMPAAGPRTGRLRAERRSWGSPQPLAFPSS